MGFHRFFATKDAGSGILCKLCISSGSPLLRIVLHFSTQLKLPVKIALPRNVDAQHVANLLVRHRAFLQDGALQKIVADLREGYTRRRPVAEPRRVQTDGARFEAEPELARRFVGRAPFALELFQIRIGANFLARRREFRHDLDFVEPDGNQIAGVVGVEQLFLVEALHVRNADQHGLLIVFDTVVVMVYPR